MATSQKLLTTEEFLLLPDTGEKPLELVRGVPTPIYFPAETAARQTAQTTVGLAGTGHG